MGTYGLPDKLTVTVKEAAYQLSLSRSQIYNMLNDGRLVASTVGSRVTRITTRSMFDLLMKEEFLYSNKEHTSNHKRIGRGNSQIKKRRKKS